MGRTKVRIQRGDNGIVMLVDHGYKNNEEDTENFKELFVFEDVAGEDSTKAFQDMTWSLLEILGYGGGGKYSTRNFYIFERPGRDCSTPIEDTKYLNLILENAYSFLSAIHDQREVYKKYKKKFPDVYDSFGLTKVKLDKILKILFDDE
jgi:hypothetical protein